MNQDLRKMSWEPAMQDKKGINIASRKRGNWRHSVILALRIDQPTVS